ncbi:MAG: hypothetical protein ACN6O2_12985 [Stenotrophomonas sp.]
MKINPGMDADQVRVPRKSKAESSVRRRRGWRLTIAVASIVPTLLMTGCGSKIEKRWVEEVRLHDGRTVTIDRYSQSARTGFPNSTIGNVLYQEIRYAPAAFSWSSPAAEQPLAFDLMDGDVYFVTIPVQALGIFCRGKPQGTYMANFYRWKSGRMEKLNQQQAPVDRLHMNITGVSRGPYSEQMAFLSVADVNAANHVSSYAEPPTLREVFEKMQKNYLMCQSSD